MSRPPNTDHLAESTQERYWRVLSKVHQSHTTNELLSWLQSRINQRIPLGTQLPEVAAVKRYLRTQIGLSEEELDRMVPQTVGTSSASRPLNAEELTVYYASLDRLTVQPAKTILSLLPVVGLKLSELCRIQKHHVAVEQGQVWLFVDGRRRRKSRIRSQTAAEKLLAYLSDQQNNKITAKGLFVFSLWSNGEDRPVQAPSVGKHLNAIENAHPSVFEHPLTASRLRATYVNVLAAQGVPMDVLCEDLGIKHTVNVRRYVTAPKKRRST